MERGVPAGEAEGVPEVIDNDQEVAAPPPRTTSRRASAARLGSLVIERLTPLVSQPRFWLVVVGVAAGLYLVYLTWEALKPVLAAGVVAYLLDDIVSRLERWHVPRVATILVLYVVGLTGCLLFLIWLVPGLVEQLNRLIADIPRLAARVAAAIQSYQATYAEYLAPEHGQQLIDRVAQEAERAASAVVNAFVYGVSSTLSNFVNVIVVLFLVFEFLRDKRRLLTWMWRFLPRQDGSVIAVLRDLDREMGGFVRGKAVVALIISGISSVGYLLLGLPSAVVWGVLTGLSTFVPYFGPTVVFFPVTLLGYLQFGDVSGTLTVAGMYTLVQTFEGYILTPWVLGRYSGIHPAAVVIAILVFGSLWGFWGIVFAVPLAIMLRRFLEELATWLEGAPSSAPSRTP